MSAPTINSPIGQAWAYHRIGRNDAAQIEFDKILRQNPDDIDALFGLGLVQRSLERDDDALASFNRVLALLTAALEREPGEDRWEMLQRMVQQRIAEIGTRR